MTTQQLLAILAIAIVANGILIAIALASMRASRRRGDADSDSEAELPAAPGPDPGLAMATAGGGALGLASPTVTAGPEPASAHDGEPSPSGSTPVGDRDEDDEAIGSVVLIDPTTGLESPVAWRRAVDDEVVRLARYHRPATVMLLELDGLDRLIERLGEDAGARLVVATARTIDAQARAADRCARFGRGRFAILMPETDEIAAINFAERIRAECDRWLEAGEVALRLALGWALLEPATGATPAILEAERRLDAERRQHAGSLA